MYMYAKILWDLQDELGVSFETACTYLSPYRKDAIERLIEFRTDVDINDYKKVEEIETKIYDDFEYSDERKQINDWYHKKNKRFKMPVDMRDINYSIDYIEPEFSYH